MRVIKGREGGESVLGQSGCDRGRSLPAVTGHVLPMAPSWTSVSGCQVSQRGSLVSSPRADIIYRKPLHHHKRPLTTRHDGITGGKTNIIINSIVHKKPPRGRPTKCNVTRRCCFLSTWLLCTDMIQNHFLSINGRSRVFVGADESTQCREKKKTKKKKKRKKCGNKSTIFIQLQK